MVSYILKWNRFTPIICYTEKHGNYNYTNSSEQEGGGGKTNACNNFINVERFIFFGIKQLD
jgi:hypothetical protein